MGVVRFYACADDPQRVTLRLLHKALREPPCSMWVMGEAVALRSLSDALWCGAGFLAHAEDGAPARVRERSALVLSGDSPPGPVGLLILLDGPGADAEGLSAERFFDVFGRGEVQRAAARARFRWHQRQGVQPELVQV